MNMIKIIFYRTRLLLIGIVVFILGRLMNSPDGTLLGDLGTVIGFIMMIAGVVALFRKSSYEKTRVHEQLPANISDKEKKEYIRLGFCHHHDMDFMPDETYQALTDVQRDEYLLEGLKLKAKQPRSEVPRDEASEAKAGIVRLGFKQVNHITISDADIEQLPPKELERYYKAGLKELDK